MNNTVNNIEKIALVDCNNFFVSCERLFRPDLAQKPVIVLSSNDGCVISRSEEAKALGFKMGEPYFKVSDMCHKKCVTVFSSNFDLYRDLSRRVMSVLRRFSDTVETYSIDEAFLILDESDGNFAEQACVIRRTVFRETGIPVAVGVSNTKTLAKVATHYAKPKRGGDGSRVLLTQNDITKALANLPVGEVWGVGFRLEPMLRQYSIHTAADLVGMNDVWIRKYMSVCGLRTVAELRSIRCFDVGEEVELRKSLLHSQSFGVQVSEKSELRASVAYHARKVSEILRAEHALAREVGIVLRTSRHTKKRYGVFDVEVLPLHTNDTLSVVQAALCILERAYRTGFLYAKAGVMVRDIVPEGAQPERTLFGEEVRVRAPLMKALDNLRYRFGDVVRVGVEGKEVKWHARHKLLSPRYTTVWQDIAVV